MPLVVRRSSDLRPWVGKQLGVSAWHEITQAVVDQFADLTGDHQWIHVDPSRARASPFGGTIAHGLLTLSLGPLMQSEIVAFEDLEFGVNYGADRLRFPAPMPVGQRVRMAITVDALDELDDGWWQVRWTWTFEVEHGTKPVCVAQILVRLKAGR